MPDSFVGRITSFHAPRLRLILALPLPALLLAFTAVTALQPAHALLMEQALAHCRATVGDPIVKPCMQRLGNSGNREANLAKCKVGVPAKVNACVNAALTHANGRANVPVAIPTATAPKAKPTTALPVGFVAPPRTIADITTILDSEKPDEKKLEQLRSNAAKQPTGSESRQSAARFYFDRANARSELGRIAEAIADADKAIEAGRGNVSPSFMNRMMQFQGVNYEMSGDLEKALETYQRQLKELAGQSGVKGLELYANRVISFIFIQMGNIAQAEAYQRRNLLAIQEPRTSGSPGWRASYAKIGQNWESDLDFGRGWLAEARGQFAEAEAAYRMGEQRRRAAMKGMLELDDPPHEVGLRQTIDLAVLWQARMKARQARLAEAEVDARRALLSRLKDVGKYNTLTPHFVMGLADILVEQGRYAEAEQLARVAVEINETLGVPSDAQWSVLMLSQFANMLTLQRKRSAAETVYGRIDKAIAKWAPARRQTFELNQLRILSLYAAGQVDEGIAASVQLVKRESGTLGEKHFDTASARGTLAVGLMLAGRDTEAAREFRSAIPVMMSAAQENASDDNITVLAGRTQRLQSIAESYFILRARDAGPAGDVGEETFSLADAIRGRSVQQALAASSARATARDPALAELVRKEQDLVKQVNAQLGMLNNVLSLPSAERDEKGVQAINASINSLRAARDKARQEINQKFPDYADLVSPKPPSVSEIKSSLAEGEALLSFYFGQSGSFVWAVPKIGPVVFAVVQATSGEIESKIRKLREALDPSAAMISDIPPLDLKIAYELYSLLLKPVESGWKSARNLIIVTNGALGLLPLSLLPTASADVLQDDDLLFAGYRKVPWLARTHAVTTLPSAAALRTLRQLPPGKPNRGELVAFGDPYFSKEQQAEAQLESVRLQITEAGEQNTRGVPLKRRNSPKLEGVDSAELALLPRLPDTAEELKSIAIALQADPSKVLFLGKDAKETSVKTMDLSGFKVLAFATHGLVPGDLNGLTQPALALSSPAVTGEVGDGLLTMEEILALKLDADWVILSACNTGAGEGAGAEAASGLGRAFFYAGTRALLVTNWAVHSQSARELVTDVFKRQADDPKLTRGEALRQAMMALVDGKGYTNASGNSEFAYAHPLFWAPYTIIGDGGRR